jgi:hypothetical protein
VTQSNARAFLAHWSGTGTIENSGDDERLAINYGQYMESEIVETGIGAVTIRLNSYKSGDSVTIKYKTGGTQSLCDSAEWTATTDGEQKNSEGYVKIRLES